MVEPKTGSKICSKKITSESLIRLRARLITLLAHSPNRRQMVEEMACFYSFFKDEIYRLLKEEEHLKLTFEIGCQIRKKQYPQM